MTTADVIVIGLGGVGSAAAWHLARRGLRVLGFDRFDPPHDHGSSHGQSRVIRKAYFEHPNYVPLLQAAYQAWHELEQASAQSLYFPVGLLEVGPVDGVIIPGILASAAEHQLPIERLSAAEIHARWPGVRVTEGDVGLFESEAGYLLVEACVAAHLRVAEQAGAELRFNEQVVSWSAEEDQVRVVTDRGEYQAARLVIAGGPWADQLLAELRLPLRLLRKDLYWYVGGSTDYRAESGMPTFLFETPAGYYYGFPAFDHRGLKVARHDGGIPLASADGLTREIDTADQALVERFLATHLPNSMGTLAEHATCIYTMTPDEHFVVDRHPEHPQVALAAGLSGHGFKFASILGRILAELATDGEASLPINFLSLRRFF
ncbi:MAG: N-methyl-L-tryptophan oxidase [Pirellulaceae bacterium]